MPFLRRFGICGGSRGYIHRLFSWPRSTVVFHLGPCDQRMKLDLRPAYHEQDPPFQFSWGYPFRSRPLQDSPDKFIAPRPVHDVDHLGLPLYPNVALEADEDGPVTCSDRVSYRFTNIQKWDALAEGVSMGNDGPFDGRPHVNLDASRAMGHNMGVSGCGRTPK